MARTFLDRVIDLSGQLLHFTQLTLKILPTLESLNVVGASVQDAFVPFTAVAIKILALGQLHFLLAMILALGRVLRLLH